ncbi:MAG: dethiobiotin synthase [Candidatus Gastranaerophilaceae bacterium]
MLELFVTGAEKNSGKILVTAGLAATMQSLGYSTGVYKPVETSAVIKNGYIQSPDLAFVKFCDPYIKTYFTYLLKSKSSPLLSAAAEKTLIDKNKILQDYQSLTDLNECMIIDGNNGLATPYGKNFLEKDMVQSLDVPLLFVISPYTSSINNVIMSINQAESSGIKLRGVIINDYPENPQDMDIKLLPKMIEEYSSAKVMGILPSLKNFRMINPNDIITNILSGVDIEGIFQIRIAKLSM